MRFFNGFGRGLNSRNVNYFDEIALDTPDFDDLDTQHLSGDKILDLIQDCGHDHECDCDTDSHDHDHDHGPIAENDVVANTIPGDTTTTETIGIGDQISGVIETANDTDWYAIDLSAGQVIDISQMGAGSGTLVDPLLRIFDDTGAQLATNDDIISGVRDSLLTFTVGTTGTYYISAEAWSTLTGTFTLSVTENTEGTADYADNSGTTASAIVNGSVSGRLETTSDSDWFEISLDAGNRYLINQYGTGSDGLEDGVLRLRDASGNIVETNDNSGPGSNAAIAINIDTSGTYYIEVDSNSQDGDYALSVENVALLEERTLDGIANFLTDEYSSRSSYNITTINFNVDGLTEGAAALAIRALEAWSEVTPLVFVETAADIAQFIFDDDDSGAYNSNSRSGGAIQSSFINVNSGWSGGTTALDSYTYQTYLHEIGHALGLGHAGPYNGSATYGTDNAYLNDSWAYTVMSYFSQSESGYFGDRRFVLGPQIADIIAIQDLYGANTTTRNGDTVYGFNSTLALTDVHNFDNPELTRGAPSLSLYDTGGIDTLDVSGYSRDARINLNDEAFSDINGIDGLISISRGSIIENAVGGSGDDDITGNSQNNVLTGGAGNDTLNGSAGADTAVFSGQYSDYTITVLGNGNLEVSAQSGADGTDQLESIEYLAFSDQTIAAAFIGVNQINGSSNIDNLVGTNGADVITALAGDDTISGLDGDDILRGGTGDDSINGGGNNDRLEGSTGNDTLNGWTGSDILIGGAGNDILDGYTGFDTAVYTGLTAGVSIDLGLTTQQDTGGGGLDTLVRIENLIGSGFNDNLTGNGGRNRLEGGNGDDTLSGLGNNDVLIGGAGNDRLEGGTGADTLQGGNNNDDLFGDAGRDRLEGGAGNDELFGGADVDRLLGGSGDDILTGGTGTDFLFGGAGNDRFVFTETTDSLVGAYQRDEIRDWNTGDIIDVSAIDADSNSAGNQAFSLIDGSFTGTAGEIMIQSLNRSGVDVQLVSFDLDGDAQADMQIWVLASELDAADFVL